MSKNKQIDKQLNREVTLNNKPYIYKTPDINESIALVNRLFWEDSIRNDKKYLQDFCFRFGIDTSAKKQLEKIEPKHFKVLCNPVVMDFLMEFSKPVKELVRNIRGSEIYISDVWDCDSQCRFKQVNNPASADLSGLFLSNSFETSRLSLDQFRAVMFINTVRKIMMSCPLEIYRTGLCYADALALSDCSMTEVLTLIIKYPPNFRLRLADTPEQLTEYIKGLRDLASQNCIKSQEAVNKFLKTACLQFGLSTKSWEDIKSYVYHIEKTDVDGEIRNKLENSSVETFSEGESIRMGYICSKPAVSVLSNIRVCQRYFKLSLDGEIVARTLLQNGIGARILGRELSVTSKVIRRVNEDIQLEYPMWREEMSEDLQNRSEATDSRSYKFKYLHDLLVSVIYMSLRYCMRSDEYATCQYALVVRNAYNLYCEHFRLDKDNVRNYRLGIKEIHRIISHENKAESDVRFCPKCRMNYLCHESAKDRCPYCRSESKLKRFLNDKNKVKEKEKGIGKGKTTITDKPTEIGKNTETEKAIGLEKATESNNNYSQENNIGKNTV